MKMCIFIFCIGVNFILGITTNFANSLEETGRQPTSKLTVSVPSNDASNPTPLTGATSPWNLGKELFGPGYKPWNPDNSVFSQLPNAQSNESENKKALQ